MIKAEIQKKRFLPQNPAGHNAAQTGGCKMKKTISIILTAAMAFAFTGCAATEKQNVPASVSSQDSTKAAEQEPLTDENVQNGSADNILVAYFSWADNAVLADDVDAVASPSVIPPGNVQQLAGWVQEETGGDLFSIRVTDPYPSDWDECLARANQERGDDARPELVENVENLDQYDTVFLGYPNWWYLSGKNVYLFCSHGTGGLANSVELITETAPEAVLSDSIFDCSEEDAASSEEDIRDWVNGLGYSQPEDADGSAAASLQEMQPLTVEEAE